MKAHKIRKFQGSSVGEIGQIVRETHHELRLKNKLPPVGGALLRALLVRQGSKGGKS